jgi:hypothetical protein|nr:MAG TPA: nucelotide kinase [Caudoviricetes sp.]DAO35044.1 MAG TPA: nucelotide kinase [Caudoviricetes sp.]
MNIKVGDKVRIKEDLSECEFGYCGYMEEFAGKETTVISTFGKGVIKLDIDEQVWDWSENVLELIEEGKTMKMKRIDYILNAKDNMQVILDETVLDCDICPVDSGVCNGDCEFYYKEYLNEEIEVDKSKLKDADIESITIGQALQSICDIPPQIKIDSDKIKEVEDVVNHPSHYTDGNIEVMDFIEDKQLNFARGNVIKYVSRAGKKDPNKELEDLLKSMWYLNREIERLKKLQGK